MRATTKGATEGGVLGGLTRGVTGIASGLVQGYTGGIVSFNASYSYDDGWGGSVSAGYGPAKATVGYSEGTGLSVSAGIQIGQGSGLSLGGSWSEKQGFGVNAGLTLGGSSGGLNLGVGWSQKEGFSGRIGVSMNGDFGNNFSGGLNAGVSFNKKGFAGVDASLTFGAKAYKDSGAYFNSSASTTVGFNYTRGGGFGISAGSRAGIDTGWKMPGGGHMEVGGGSTSTFNFDRGGKYRGSSFDVSSGMQYVKDAKEQGKPQKSDGFFKDFFGGIKDSVTGIWDSLKTFGGNTVDTFKRVGNLLKNGKYEIGKDLGLSDSRYDEWTEFKKARAEDGEKVDFGNKKNVLDFYTERMSADYEGIQESAKSRNAADLRRYSDNIDNIQIINDSSGKYIEKGGVLTIIDRSPDASEYTVIKFDQTKTVAVNNHKVDLSGVQGDPTKAGAMQYTNVVFKTIKDVLDDAETIFTGDKLNFSKTDRFRYTVNSARDTFKDMKFENQTQLNYTFAGVMKNLGKEFDIRTDRGIPYGYPGNTFNQNGLLNNIGTVDCAALVNIGINIIGFNNPDAPNVNNYNGNAYKYREGYENNKHNYSIDNNSFVEITKTEPIFMFFNHTTTDSIQGIRYDNDMGAVTNMAYNTIFDVINSSDDLTGLIGVTAGDGSIADRAYDEKEGRIRWRNDDGKLNHVYVSTNQDSSSTIESTSFQCYNNGQKKWTSGIRLGDTLDYNKNSNKYYLQIRLTDNRTR